MLLVTIASVLPVLQSPVQPTPPSAPSAPSATGGLEELGVPDLGHDVRLAPGERLLAYAWSGRWMVPSAASGPSVRVDHGERGLRPGARLYLPGHSPLEALASDARVVDEHALDLVDGRFGSALGFRPESRLRVALLRPGDGRGWTLSAWVRPDPASLGAGERLLLRAAGAVDVWLEGGRVRADLAPSGESLAHPSPLPAGEWSYVSVAYDPVLLRALRVFARDSSVQATVASGSPARIATELVAGDVAHDGTGFVGALDDVSLEPLAASTEESLLRAGVDAAPGRHELHLWTTLGRRTLELASGITRELALDRPEELARGGLEHAVVADGVLRWAPGHWIELDPGPAPPPRTTHPLVGLGDRRMFTFAGETRDSHHWPMRNTADTWIYDGARNRWTEIAGPGPSPRCHMPAAYSADHDAVLVVGGVRFDVTPWEPNGDTWLFHVGQRRWEQRFPSGAVVGNTSDHGLVYLPRLGRFLLMRNQRNMLYDPVADAWELLPVSTAVTPAGQPTTYTFGGSTMCALDERSGLVVTFGGSYGPNQDVFGDTTAFYDVAANRYTVLDPPTRPSPRVRSAFAHDPRRGHFVLFGGVQGQFSQRHDDLWVFEPRARRWREVECSNRPPVCGGYYGMVYDEVADRFLLFSGRSAPDRWLSRTWALELDETRRGTARYTFDRIDQPGSTRWFADVETPGDSRVEFAVRTSDDAARWSRWRRASDALPPSRYVQLVAMLTPGTGGEAPSVRSMGWR